jgi:protein-S-isoprenylcysteine O-methyltransferase Ste14
MPSYGPYQIALYVLYSCFTAIRIHYRRKARRGSSSPRWNADARLLSALIAFEIGTFAIYGLAPGWLSWAEIPLPPLVRWSGTATGVLSLLLFVWVHRSLGKNYSPLIALRDDHTLVTRGPYRWVRHPMYGAFYLLHVAVFLLSANAFIGLTWIGGLTGVVVLRIPQEERMLTERFGNAYIEYAQRTGRLLPDVFGKRLPERQTAATVPQKARDTQAQSLKPLDESSREEDRAA